MSPTPARRGAVHRVRRHEIWSSAETAADVLQVFLGRATPAGLVEVSHREVADELDIGVNTAKRAIRRLTDHGVVTLERLGTNGEYRSRYRLALSRTRPIEPVA